MSAYALRTRGPQRPMSLIVGTMRVKRLVRYTRMSSEWSTHSMHSSTGRPRLPDLLAEEPVAHQVAALDDELLALVALLRGELRVVVPQREPAEGHVARLVLHHVGGDGLRQRVLGVVADQAERRERQALDEHLHAEVGHVPARVAQRVVEQALQVRIDRVDELELLVQQARRPSTWRASSITWVAA